MKAEFPMSDTGYIYLTFAQLQEVCLVHLISGMDEDGGPDQLDAAVATAITGYTEWISEGNVTITIGWDWQMLPDKKTIRLYRVSEPSSNLMLQSANGIDLGPKKTTILLETFIDGINWESETLKYINIRYDAGAE
jgi:hypothetical protein